MVVWRARPIPPGPLTMRRFKLPPMSQWPWQIFAAISLVLWALFAALALAAPAAAQTPNTKPPPEIVGTATSGDGAVITLYARPGPCVGHARLAEHKTRGGVTTPGCWLLAGAAVLVSFFDGERGDIPTNAVVLAKDI